MKKHLMTFAVLMAVVTVLVMPMGVTAGSANQSASTNAATTISVLAQDYTTSVSTITFPAGAIGSTVSLPVNGVSTEVQTFGETGTAKPVVTLVNGGSVAYTMSITVSSWDPSGVVASEYYLINAKGAACTTADSITSSVNFGTPFTGGTIDTGTTNAKDLYLKITLGTTANRTATSSITVLGEN